MVKSYLRPTDTKQPSKADVDGRASFSEVILCGEVAQAVEQGRDSYLLDVSWSKNISLKTSVFVSLCSQQQVLLGVDVGFQILFHSVKIYLFLGAWGLLYQKTVFHGSQRFD